MRNKSINKISIIVLLTIACCYGTNSVAQIKVGNNPNTINPNAVLDIESTNKGLLLPRIALVSTTSAAPMTGFVTGMFVYNTATVNDISDGIYYCDGSKWIKVNQAGTAASSITVQKRTEIVAVNGQTIFNTPSAITDINKISLFRNGTLISFSINNANSIVAEIPCTQGDEMRIIQLL